MWVLLKIKRFLSFRGNILETLIMHIYHISAGDPRFVSVNKKLIICITFNRNIQILNVSDAVMTNEVKKWTLGNLRSVCCPRKIIKQNNSIIETSVWTYFIPVRLSRDLPKNILNGGANLSNILKSLCSKHM